MKYKIGQKVVYIGSDWASHPIIRAAGLTVPVPGKIYTIRGGRPDMVSLWGIVPAYLLEEIVNPVRFCELQNEEVEAHVVEASLRPLQERKNDGEAFVAGLRPLLKQVWRIRVPQ